MREVTPIRPVVELRETFTPSEHLRDAFVDFLDPNLDPQTIESLRAAFLFRSYRRRIIDQQSYYHHERDGIVHEAALRFAALPHTPMLLNGEINVGYNREVGRIIVRTRQNDAVRESYNILNSIPTIEERLDDVHESRMFYVDIAKRSLASLSQVEVARGDLHKMAIHPATAAHYYLTPDQIAIRDTMANIRPPREEDKVG